MLDLVAKLVAGLLPLRVLQIIVTLFLTRLEASVKHNPSAYGMTTEVGKAFFKQLRAILSDYYSVRGDESLKFSGLKDWFKDKL